MKIKEFAKMIDREISVEKVIHREGYVAEIKGLEIKDDGIFDSCFGHGKTKHQALKDYAERIQGKIGMTYAYYQSIRREWNIPDKMTV